MVEEDAWSGVHQVRKTISNIEDGAWKKRKTGYKRTEWETRRDADLEEAVLGTVTFDFDEQAEGQDLEFNVVRRLEFGEESETVLEEAQQTIR